MKRCSQIIDLDNKVSDWLGLGLPAHDVVFNFFKEKSLIFKVYMPIFYLRSS